MEIHGLKSFFNLIIFAVCLFILLSAVGLMNSHKGENKMVKNVPIDSRNKRDTENLTNIKNVSNDFVHVSSQNQYVKPMDPHQHHNQVNNEQNKRSLQSLKIFSTTVDPSVNNRITNNIRKGSNDSVHVSPQNQFVKPMDPHQHHINQMNNKHNKRDKVPKTMNLRSLKGRNTTVGSPVNYRMTNNTRKDLKAKTIRLRTESNISNTQKSENLPRAKHKNNTLRTSRNSTKSDRVVPIKTKTMNQVPSMKLNRTSKLLFHNLNSQIIRKVQSPGDGVGKMTQNEDVVDLKSEGLNDKEGLNVTALRFKNRKSNSDSKTRGFGKENDSLSKLNGHKIVTKSDISDKLSSAVTLPTTPLKGHQSVASESKHKTDKLHTIFEFKINP